MAAVLALVSAVLLSQIATSTASKSPFTVELPCSSYTEGCQCAAVGKVDNTSADSVAYSSTQDDCCKYITPKNCMEALSTATSDLCGADMMVNLPALTTAAGATPKTTCCKTKPTVTCADVTCTSRRRSDAAKYKRTASAASTACTSEDDCDTKCCEKDMAMCINADSGSNAYTCGTNKTKKATTPSTCSNGVWTSSMTATATMTVTNEAGFQSTCCEAVPAVPAPSPCPSSPSCPATMEKDSAKTTYSASESECCKTLATACMSLCGGGYATQGGDSCGVGAKSVCTSSTCDNNQVLDLGNVFATGDDAAAKKTKCCIAKVTATGRTCSTWRSAAAAEAKKATTSAAQFKVASLAVLVLGAFMIKFAL